MCSSDLFRDHPDAITRTVEIARACTFSLDELRYEYPVDPVPDGRTPRDELVRLTRQLERLVPSLSPPRELQGWERLRFKLLRSQVPHGDVVPGQWWEQVRG